MISNIDLSNIFCFLPLCQNRYKCIEIKKNHMYGFIKKFLHLNIRKNSTLEIWNPDPLIKIATPKSIYSRSIPKKFIGLSLKCVIYVFLKFCLIFSIISSNYVFCVGKCSFANEVCKTETTWESFINAVTNIFRKYEVIFDTLQINYIFIGIRWNNMLFGK